MKWSMSAWFLLCVAATAAAAESTAVYRRVGPDGVVTFSDQPSAGAEEIDVDIATPDAEEVARADERFQQQLDMIDVLEQSRRADEAERAKARELDLAIARAEAARAAAEASAALPEDDRYVYAPWYGPGYPSWGPGHRPPGHRPPGPHPPRPGADPIPPKPLPSRPLGRQ
jgi:hypothetical protein